VYVRVYEFIERKSLKNSGRLRKLQIGRSCGQMENVFHSVSYGHLNVHDLNTLVGLKCMQLNY
jgi:hypothetical protein